jgi:hypothetical protein
MCSIAANELECFTADCYNGANADIHQSDLVTVLEPVTVKFYRRLSNVGRKKIEIIASHTSLHLSSSVFRLINKFLADISELQQS